MATGSMPAMRAKVVIRMGRRRLRPAAISASSRGMPVFSSTREASSNRMAFFATRPISMMTPMRLMRLIVALANSNAMTTPMRLSGSDSITGSGALNEPNWMTRMRYIMATPATSAVSMSVNTACWSRELPASSSPKPGGKFMAWAILKASAVTSPGERPCALLDTEIVRLPSACWICDGPLPMVMAAIWSSGTMRLVPSTATGRRSMLLASTRSSGCRRTATSRASPVGSIQSPTSTPAKATRSACAASLTEMPSALARPRSRSIFSSSCGSCSDSPTSTAPGISRILAMNSVEMASSWRASGPVKRICTGLAAPMPRSSITTYSAPTNRATSLRSSTAISLAERWRLLLLPMST